MQRRERHWRERGVTIDSIGRVADNATASMVRKRLEPMLDTPTRMSPTDQHSATLRIQNHQPM